MSTKKRIKKTLLVAGAVTSVGLASLLGTGMVSAATATDTGGDSLISKLAQKFNLKEGDVQAVFDQDRTAHQAEHEADAAARLQKLVDAGTITADQKTLIENKAKELQKTRETERTELQSWAKSQNIDERYVMMHGPDGDNASRLQDLVDAGKLTAGQKTAIEAKQAELKEKHDTAQEALKKWAEDNKIDQKYLMMGGGHGGPGGYDGPAMSN